MWRGAGNTAATSEIGAQAIEGGRTPAKARSEGRASAVSDTILWAITPVIKPEKSGEDASAVSPGTSGEDDFALVAARKRVWWARHFGLPPRKDDIKRIVLKGGRTG